MEREGMAAGKVVTGFSKPYVAKYNNNKGTITYTEGRVLARGVEVSIEPDTPSDNNFSADNVTAETAPGIFTGGTCTLTVDGLLTASERFIMGIPEPKPVNIDGTKTVEVMDYGDNMTIPYMGVGFLVRYQSNGNVEYVPMILTKTRFHTTGTSAATQDGDIDWQTQELTTDLMRDDSPNRNWKRVAQGFETELEAEDVLKKLLGITGTDTEGA